jgi:hypothetical protein
MQFFNFKVSGIHSYLGTLKEYTFHVMKVPSIIGTLNPNRLIPKIILAGRVLRRVAIEMNPWSLLEKLILVQLSKNYLLFMEFKGSSQSLQKVPQSTIS